MKTTAPKIQFGIGKTVSSYVPIQRCPTCDNEPEEAPHTCPFREEINNDRRSTCTCCHECEYQCAMDI